MNKKFTYIFVFLICIFINTTAIAKSNEAKIGYQQVKVNGLTSNIVTYNISGENYYRIRDIAFALRNTNKKFNVNYNVKNNEIYLISGENYSSKDDFVIYDDIALANAFTGSILLDKEVLDLNSYHIKGYNYYKLNDIAKILNFNIKYEGVNKLVVINTSEGYSIERNKVSILIDEFN
ncbi:hypothetical protein [Peptoniphilus stercorisuis]|uniref:Copper amine oxidase-like N-terminal domain-containing protein n=1 Tax=Peptoniphilus stercorisuis TaxID=1436965 RepID=A0ABS4KEQ6_9FIRM|nr:hypothetical protein [Peptoniphilus stercorisuis]MBP2025761.1 hypothetical protein [Peptoniphilus stercorisuis]